MPFPVFSFLGTPRSLAIVGLHLTSVGRGERLKLDKYAVHYSHRFSVSYSFIIRARRIILTVRSQRNLVHSFDTKLFRAAKNLPLASSYLSAVIQVRQIGAGIWGSGTRGSGGFLILGERKTGNSFTKGEVPSLWIVGEWALYSLRLFASCAPLFDCKDAPLLLIDLFRCSSPWLLDERSTMCSNK